MKNMIRLMGFAHANGVTMLLAIFVGLSAWDKVLADPYPPTINLADIEEAGGVRLFGELGRPTGFVNGIGDVNSDGIDDIIISDPEQDPGGRSYVLFGSPSDPASPVDLTNLDVTVGFRIDGAVSNGYSGGSVSSAGDFNDDGISDFLIGAKTVSPIGRNLAGVTYVLFGRKTGFPELIDLGKLGAPDGVAFVGAEALQQSGWSVDTAGDVNADQIEDIVIGAPFANPNGIRSGSVYVVFGRRGNFNTPLDLHGLDGTNGFRIDGEAFSDDLGWSVSSAGDFNGDGTGDIVVGAPNANSNGNDSGSSYVIFGGQEFSSSLLLADLPMTAGFRIDGAFDEEKIGHSVSSAGDINHDGFDDIVLGSGDTRQELAQSCYVVFGHNGAISSPVLLSELNGTNGFRLEGAAGAATGDRAGNFVSDLGDVNGDGMDDLVVGAPGEDGDDLENSGGVFVVFGKAEQFEPNINLMNLTGQDGFRISGEKEWDNAGTSVASAGDFNDDGVDDVILMSTTYGKQDSNSTFRGAFILYGRIRDGVFAANFEKNLGTR